MIINVMDMIRKALAMNRLRRKVVELRCVESQSIGMVQNCEGYEMTRAGEVPFGPRFGTAKNRTGEAVMC